MDQTAYRVFFKNFVIINVFRQKKLLLTHKLDSTKLKRVFLLGDLNEKFRQFLFFDEKFHSIWWLFRNRDGGVILVWGDLIIASTTQMQVIPSYPLYWRVMGLLAIALGILQVIASYQPERYVIIPIVACCVRFVLPILTIIQISDTPSMTGLLALSTVFDFLLAAVTFILLYYNGLLWKKNRKSKQ